LPSTTGTEHDHYGLLSKKISMIGDLMTTASSEIKHHLSGNWTITGVVAQLQSLSGYLQHLVSAGKKLLHIDCGSIDAIDLSGLQLLHVWMELVHLNGVKTHLVNLSDAMQATIRQFGLGQCFLEDCPEIA
jgi:anti-anti-sigma regulatory factor